MHFTMAKARRKVGTWFLERWRTGLRRVRHRPAGTEPDPPAPAPAGTPPLEAALRAGRGFGSVRTSVLEAALDQLRASSKAEAQSAERRQLLDAIERQLMRRRSGGIGPDDLHRPLL